MSSPWTKEQLIHAHWAAGELSWILRHDSHQVEEYKRYRAWEKQPPSEALGHFGRIYVMDWARRTGKSTCRLTIRFEDCLRHFLLHGKPGTYRFASAFQKDIEEIVDDVSRFILETCPQELKPEFKTASKARPAGFYFPEAAGGSVLLTVGLDKNPNGLRGRSCDGDDISEAGFVRHLEYTAKNVLYPQYQGKPWARMCFESSAPEEPDTPYDTVFVADAQVRGAYTFATIEDNTRLSRPEKDEFIQAAGGRGDPDCEREYFGRRGRSASVIICPDFDPDIHVAESPIIPPEWALCYTIGDAGWFPDLFAWLWGWVDYERAKLVIKACWTAHNAGTKELAEVCSDGEKTHFKGIKRWDGQNILQQWGPPPAPDDGVWRPDKPDPVRDQHRPYARILDADPRLRSDLGRADLLHFVAANNQDPDAQFHRLNRDFTDLTMEIDPDAVEAIAHIQAAHRDRKTGKLARSEVHGHYDVMRCAAYFSIMAARHIDPKPPAWVLDPKLVVPRKTHHPQRTTEALNEIVKPRRWKPQGQKRRRVKL